MIVTGQGRRWTLCGKEGVFCRGGSRHAHTNGANGSQLTRPPDHLRQSVLLDLSGYSMEEVVGQQPRFMSGSGTNLNDDARFRQALEQDHDAVIETVQFPKDGSRFLASVLLSAFKGEGRTLHRFLSYQDVTDRETMKGPLPESVLHEPAASEGEAQLRLLVGTQAMWETDAEGVLVADSPNWRAYTGHTLDEWLGYGWLDAIHPDDRSFAERQWREAIAATRVVNAEFRLRAPDGGYRWTSVRVVPVLDAEGKIAKWTGMNIDIDSRKRAEQALRESEERQAFLLSLGDAMRAETDIDGLITVAARILGERLGASRILFAEFDHEFGVAHIFSGWFADGARPFPTTMKLEEFEGSILDQLRAGRTVRVEDTADPASSEPDFAAIGELGVAALLSVPLLIAGKLVVNLSVHQHTTRRWSDFEVALTEDVAERLWADLVRVRAQVELRESEARLQSGQPYSASSSSCSRPKHEAGR